MSKKLASLLLWVLFINHSNAQPPNWAWAKSACSLSAATSITSITTDPSGNIFIGGNFRDSALFGSTAYHPVGTANLFLAKYNTAGDFLWMQQAKGANAPPYDLITAICTDTSGNCYITGYFNGLKIFGHDTVVSMGSNPDVFIAKYNPSGILMWLKQGTGPGSDYANGIGLDIDGNCYVAGSFEQGITFGSTVLSANNSSNDIFILKIDPSGNIISAHGTGGSALDLMNSLAVDKDGNCFVTGTFNSQNIIFGSDTLYSTNTNVDAFIAKFDSSGNALWGRAGSGPGNQEPSGIAADEFGNCYATGIFKGDTMFLDTTTLVTYGYFDFFTAVYDGSGLLTWAGHQGSATFGTENSTAITTDTSGNFYTTGQVRNPSTFDPIVLSSAGALDIFIAKFNASGSAEWVQQSGSSSSTLTSTAMHRDADGNIFITGVFEQSTTIGTDSLLVVPGYISGYYIAKLGNGINTGIQNTGVSSSPVTIYPNPVTDKLHITNAFNHSSVSVYDLTGSRIYQTEEPGTEYIDVKYFPSGIYFLQIATGSSIQWKKFIKL